MISVLRDLDIEFDDVVEPDDTVSFSDALMEIRSVIETGIRRHPTGPDGLTPRAERLLEKAGLSVAADHVEVGILVSLFAAGSATARDYLHRRWNKLDERLLHGPRKNPTRYQTARKRFAERVSWAFEDPKDMRALIKVMKDLDIEYDDVLAMVGDDTKRIGFADVVSTLSDIIVRSQDLPYAYAPATLTSKGQRWYELLHSDEQIYFSTTPVMYGIWLSLALEGSPRAKRHIEKQSWWQHWLRISKYTKL